ncbi:hypothetical protein QC762_0072410 [Podospora pseudocomata]|uniref:Uncharacterized protein n=1 Tax=Podospora pseudocomata TaxID=2093779 RepID=A0ABR0GH45_9PEZI|nr:hypothetical protein QC762_0072410 [Podospora pseudocomata]
MAFFADVGGFVFEAAASGPFPLNAKQLHWLVVNNHIEDPETDVVEIWYKSKQDRFARLITSFQVSYTIIHAIGRAGQRLAITTLELNTMDIVVCSLMTAYAWLHKRADVRTPIRLATRTAIGDITGDRPWRTTPIDFIDENGPGRTLNVQPFMKMPVIPPDQPIQRIPNDRFPMNPYACTADICRSRINQYATQTGRAFCFTYLTPVVVATQTLRVTAVATRVSTSIPSTRTVTATNRRHYHRETPDSAGLGIIGHRISVYEQRVKD